jgi:hypothetical protein
MAHLPKTSRHIQPPRIQRCWSSSQTYNTAAPAHRHPAGTTRIRPIPGTRRRKSSQCRKVPRSKVSWRCRYSRLRLGLPRWPTRWTALCRRSCMGDACLLVGGKLAVCCQSCRPRGALFLGSDGIHACDGQLMHDACRHASLASLLRNSLMFMQRRPL